MTDKRDHRRPGPKAEQGEAEKKQSAVEEIKLGSDYLRGTVAEELANDSPSFGKEAVQVIKHHGMYQQDDRDLRRRKGPDGKPLGKAYSMMVRVKIPGGILSCDQMLAQLDLCDELGNTTLRITDRQDIQLHGILKGNVKQTLQRINEVQLTTLGACGDVNRNVMCCPAPLQQDGVRDELQHLARLVSDHLLPRSTAYHEIWLTDPDSREKSLVGGGAEGHEIEPIYGRQYLPRKFKVAFALPDDNCVDVFTNDLGFVAATADGKIVGLHVFVGGGLGVTPSNPNTFPALSKPLAYIPTDQLLAVAEAIVKVQRDFGERTDRKRARMKYLIADWGMDRFRAKVEEYYGRPLPPPRELKVTEVDDHIGWHPQGDGRWFYGLNVENGRVLDRDGFTLKSAIREVCERFRTNVRLTPRQSILFLDLNEEDRPALEEIFRRHGVKLDDEISQARRWSMACVALPTCPLAVTESERVMPGLIDQLEAELDRLQLSDERFTFHMTGCPNGCARPYNADIGLVGRTKDKYTIYLGGSVLGDRLAAIYTDTVPFDEIIPSLTRVLEIFAASRQPGESLGDFCHRVGMQTLREQSGVDQPA